MRGRGTGRLLSSINFHTTRVSALASHDPPLRPVQYTCIRARDEMENLTISGRSEYLILVLVETGSEFLVAFLRRSGYTVSEAQTTDHLVALCLNNPVHAVIVDICELAEIEGWSVAESIKLVNPAPVVILLFHGAIPEVALPTGVDAMATDSDLPGLLTILRRPTSQKAAVRIYRLMDV